MSRNLPAAASSGTNAVKKAVGIQAEAAREDIMRVSQAPGIIGPFAGLDVPWLLNMRAEARRGSFPDLGPSTRLRDLVLRRIP